MNHESEPVIDPSASHRVVTFEDGSKSVIKDFPGSLEIQVSKRQEIIDVQHITPEKHAEITAVGQESPKYNEISN